MGNEKDKALKPTPTAFLKTAAIRTRGQDEKTPRISPRHS